MDTHASSDLFFGNCVNCCKAVHGVGRACHAMGKLFHDTCFTCSICCKQLSGKTFYFMSGKIFCEDDFLYSGVHPPEICNACGHLVNDMVLQARGKSYHPACFCCAICSGNLEGLPFTVGSDDKIYCLKDYHRLQAPRCTACGMPIVPSEGSTESIRVVSFNRSYHVECYDTMMNLT